MPTKTGMGGNAPEAYDSKTGKFIEDGTPNVRHDNPVEANKIKNHISPEKIQEQSAAKQTAPTSNLGKYAKPHSSERETVLKEDFGVEPNETKMTRAEFKEHANKVLRDYLRMGLDREDIEDITPESEGIRITDPIHIRTKDGEFSAFDELELAGGKRYVAYKDGKVHLIPEEEVIK